jgi:hypothetical protein
VDRNYGDGALGVRATDFLGSTAARLLCRRSVTTAGPTDGWRLRHGGENLTSRTWCLVFLVSVWEYASRLLGTGRGKETRRRNRVSEHVSNLMVGTFLGKKARGGNLPLGTFRSWALLLFVLLPVTFSLSVSLLFFLFFLFCFSLSRNDTTKSPSIFGPATLMYCAFCRHYSQMGCLIVHHQTLDKASDQSLISMYALCNRSRGAGS